MKAQNFNPDRFGRWSISGELIASEAESRGYIIDVRDFEKSIFTISGEGKTFLSKDIDCEINTCFDFGLSKHIDHSSKIEKTRAMVSEKNPAHDYQIVIIGAKLVAAALLYPPSVIGDGENTIEYLIDEENKNPMRGKGDFRSPWSYITVDSVVEECLATKGLSLKSVPCKGKKVFLCRDTSLSRGGISIDVTDLVHSSVQTNCIQAANERGMRLCTIHFRCHDISRDISESQGLASIMSHTPELRTHHFPSAGQVRDVAKAIVDELFT